MYKISERNNPKTEFSLQHFVKPQDSSVESQAKHVVNEFNEFFANVGVRLASALPVVAPPAVTDAVLELRPVTLETLTSGVQELRVNSASGCDGLNATLIKKNFEGLAYPLRHIVNLDYSQWRFSVSFQNWESDPFFKSGLKDSMNNFIPITFLTIF